MKFKSDVVWANMHVSMWFARLVIDQAFQDLAGREAVITSARRKKTPGGSSLHPEGRALDIRVWSMDTEGRQKTMTVAEQRAMAAALRASLGPGFDVIIEGPAAENPAYQGREPHIHVEYEGA